MSDTIVAVSTSLASKAGINVIRISGPDSAGYIERVFSSPALKGEMIPNRMYLGRVSGRNFAERAFCVRFAAPRSYTGEDVAEIHCHGGRGVASAILRLIRSLGARAAEPGEFTKRAFLNGKMSLNEAEGVIDMINAETECQIRNAYRIMNGEVTAEIRECEKILVEACAMLEAALDYPEELEEETREPARRNLSRALERCEEILRRADRRKTLNAGIDVAIVGVPNAGKSSLLNALVGEDRAIVTGIAGTTRDIVKESIELDGIRLNFLDTAGLRYDPAGEIEELGMAKTRRAIEAADVVLFVLDSELEESRDERRISDLLAGKSAIRVLNKTDVGKFSRPDALRVSAKTKAGIDAVFDEILARSDREAICSECVVSDERHVRALEACAADMREALEAYDAFPPECALENARAALTELGRITGATASEEIINEVFSRFCVGK